MIFTWTILWASKNTRLDDEFLCAMLVISMICDGIIIGILLNHFCK